MNSLFRINQNNQINKNNNLQNNQNNLINNPFTIKKNIIDNKINNIDNKTAKTTQTAQTVKTTNSIQDIKYWEYGNSGLKIQSFNKIMSKNLSILYYLDKIFTKFLEENPEITIKNLFKLKISKIFEVNLQGKIICSNTGIIINLDHNKISGQYKLIGAGISTVSNIKILPEELIKLKVPNLNDVLENLDNIKLILKLTNILNLYNNFDIKDDVSNKNLNLYSIITNSLNIITKYRDNDKEKNLLKSNSNSAFYIKIYDTHGKAFIIDGLQKIIYYICETEFDNKIIFKYYIFNISDDWKII